jgi:hypothetical protein
VGADERDIDAAGDQRLQGGIGGRLCETIGLDAARRRGRRGGRPNGIDAEKLAAVVVALDAGATKASVCRTFGIARSTLVDSLARIGWSAGVNIQGGVSGAPSNADRGPDIATV